MADRRMPRGARRPNRDGIESAEYIAELTTELAKLARRSRLELLGYLLDIASLEAKTLADRVEKRPPEEGRRRTVQAVQG